MLSTVTGAVDMTISELLGLLGKVIGWIIICVCCVNYGLKGVKLILDIGIISGFLTRVVYLMYGLILTPLLLLTMVVVSPMFPLCMLYTKVICPVMTLASVYLDVCIEYTNIIPEFILMICEFAFKKAGDTHRM